MLLMQPIHLAIGIVEGLVTAGVISFIRAARPELLESAAGSKPLSPETGVRKIVLAFLAIAIVTGGIISWFASTNPDGLEWSIAKVYGKKELSGRQNGLAMVLKAIQDRTAFLPDYTFKETEGSMREDTAKTHETGSTLVAPGTSVSGILGTIMMVALISLVGFGIKAVRRKGAPPNGVSRPAG